MAFAANVSKPKTISKTRAGSIRTVELKGPLPKAMNIGDGNREKDEYMCGRRHGLKWGQDGTGGAKGPWHGWGVGCRSGRPPGPKVTTEPSRVLYLCSYEDIVDGCDGFFKVSGLDTDDDVKLG